MNELLSLWPQSSGSGISNDWTERLADHLESQSFQSLSEFIANEYETHTVFPTRENIFGAFELTSYADTKVVILGQDPYHGPGQAHGLSFSVLGDMKLPPSLRNIFKELASDLDCVPPTAGNLTAWAEQGVLMLNTVLTVRSAEANSHRKRGWETFTDSVITSLNDHPRSIVFILWGKPAEKKSALIDDRHCKIISPHPSPLSAHRGFFGSRPFSAANMALKDFSRSEIQWAKSKK